MTMAKLAHPSTTDPHYAWFHCPACDNKHAVSTGPGGWGWNGSHDAPTLMPSVLARTGRALDPSFVPQEGDPPEICHSFVTDGRIQFLSDCTHELAGKTVDLPELKE
jgi:hypothetical protein